LRAMRVAGPTQLTLQLGGRSSGADRWCGLPDEARRQVLTLLGRLIARGVIADDDPAAGPGGGR